MLSKKDFKKITGWLWEIPKAYRDDMRVPARIYASEKMLEDIFRDQSIPQLINTATLPGIVKYALAMPDAHEGYGFCVHPTTKILSHFGFYLPIKNFQKIWDKQLLKIFDFGLQKITEAPIQKFLKIKPNNKVFKVITESGKEIIATEDHPFYTSDGMIKLGKVNCGDKVALFPFEGVPYEKPSNQIIINEKDIKKVLIKTGIKEDSRRFNIILHKLEKRNLIPLFYNHSKLPYILKIMGFVFGDASMNFIGRRGDGVFHFAGKPEDLEEARKDLKEIGYTASPIHFRKIRTRTGKLVDSYSFLVNASSLVILLEALGAPRGSKVDQPFRIPKWIFKAPLWQKRLFLASLFGSELRCPHRRLDRRGNFNAPSFPIGKRIELLDNAKAYLKDISKLLKEFQIRILYIEQSKNKKHINTKGQVSWGLSLVISPSLENLMNLWSKIGFEYNQKRAFFANVAVQYLRVKQKLLKEKEKAIKFEIPQLLKLGLSYQKIADQLATGNPLTKRFIADVCYKLNKGIKKITPRITPNFPLFKDYLKQVTEGFGRSGVVWDEVVEIKEIPYKNWVYDFTVVHPDHNFIANNFVVSNCIGNVVATKLPDGIISPGGIGFDQNCGVRLLKSEYSEKEIQPYLDKLATEIQKEVPSGLGRGRQIKLDIPSINKILEGGAQRLVEQGYGEKEDVENCEAGGKLEWADASAVSEHAKNRGRDQVGTLGSGNHFCQLDKIEEIFDEEVAKAFGLFKNQIVVMVHTGSRGLGHQNCTDYLRIVLPVYPKYGIKLPDRELACVPFNSPEGQRFFKAMCAGANYAWANRQMIAHYTKKAWKSVLGEKENLKLLYDVAHNIAKIEKYKINGEEMELCVHRKGATRAFPPGHPEIPARYREVGQPVIIPGSMGTASYVLVGTKESEEAWHTVCHGAGRTMSRRAATRAVSGQEVVKKLGEKGILIKCWSLRGIAEEAPIAYKNIDDVVEVVHNAGLSKKVARLVPLAVIKGE